MGLEVTMSFKVSKSYMEDMKKQLNDFQSQGVISEQQKNQMIAEYEVKKGVNLIRLVSVVGAVLVGLGILTYIAGNWQNMSPMFRMGLILVGMLGFYTSGMQLDGTYPRTGRALRYIALFIFGGGLFLTDQTFHLNRTVAFHFLIWSVGVFIVMHFEKDNFLLYFFQVLLGATAMALFEHRGMSSFEFAAYFFVLASGVLLAIRLSDNQYKTGLSAFFSVGLVFFTIMTLLVYWEVDGFYGALLYLLIGLGLLLRPVFGKHATFVVNQMGLVIAGFSGFILTFKDVWENVLSFDGTTPSVLFTITFLLALFYLVKREYAGAIPFIALVILRYYFDTFYDFMPKSLFFVIGGGILLGFGVYLESVRRKGLKKNA